jgi:hypothetical protein
MESARRCDYHAVNGWMFQGLAIIRKCVGYPQFVGGSVQRLLNRVGQCHHAATADSSAEVDRVYHPGAPRAENSETNGIWVHK